MPRAEQPVPEQAPPKVGVRTAVVKADDVGMRLDRWFAREIPDLGHVRLQKLLRTGQVRVDGGRVAANARLAAGQTIRIPPLPGLGEKRPDARRAPKVSDSDARDLQARVLYLDDDVIAINKPEIGRAHV